MSIAKNSPILNYNISIPEPHTHYAEVEISIQNPGKTELEFQMPVWTPGSYLIREFEKSIQNVSASADKKPLLCKKTDKNTWKVNIGKSNSVSFKYKVYAYEFSVRTSFIDADQALINPTSLCFLVKGLEKNEGTISFSFGSNFSRVSTALKRTETDGQKNQFTFADYDELADNPIQIGNHQELTFKVAGVPHKVAMVGRHNADTSKFIKDLTKICLTMTNIIGEHPSKEYLFIVQNVETGGGGLEHKNSTVVMMNRFAWTDPARYKSFLGLCAHEYFHLWNVKRIRPVELGPFNYSSENYTEQLWVAEGITSYYDELAMMRAGFVTHKEFLTSLSTYVNDLENRPGSKVQTLAESSWDAWIKEYRPNENSKNTSISYYSKGLVVAALLDAEIATATNGKRNLDDLMKLLWIEFYKKADKGFTVKEFEAAASVVAGKDLSAFFDKHVRSTATPDYESIWNKAGLNVSVTTDSKYLSGMTTALENGKTIVKYTEYASPAYVAGINVNDEIIAIGGIRINNDVEDVLKKLGNPKQITFIVSRTGQIKEIEVPMQPTEKFNISLKAPSTADNWPPVLKKWLITD